LEGLPRFAVDTSSVPLYAGIWSNRTPSLLTDARTQGASVSWARHEASTTRLIILCNGQLSALPETGLLARQAAAGSDDKAPQSVNLRQLLE